MVKLRFYSPEQACDIVGGCTTKGEMAEFVCRSYGIPIEKTLYIGDSTADIALMEKTGFCGCPSNAQDDVKKYVRKRKGFVSKKDRTEACLRAFKKYEEEGLFAIISDVDGCLRSRGITTDEQLAQISSYVKNSKGFYTSHPPLTICTGRSYEQSVEEIIKPMGFTAANIAEEYLETWPPLMFENGSVLYHVHSGTVENVIQRKFPDYLQCINHIKRRFDERKHELDCLIDKEGLVIPFKRNMFTIDVPLGLRGTGKGKEFQEKVFEIVNRICDNVGIEIKKAGGKNEKDNNC
ncbi:MAG: HAD hydrolase family protein [Candidatus Woesearchaeota archaeon]